MTAASAVSLPMYSPNSETLNSLTL
jgi:hypothetical protein